MLNSSMLAHRSVSQNNQLRRRARTKVYFVGLPHCARRQLSGTAALTRYTVYYSYRNIRLNYLFRNVYFNLTAINKLIYMFNLTC